MPDSHPQAMPKEICCRNWVHLLDYIENTPNLQGGFSGRAAVEKVLEGLVDNPEYLIEDPDNPDKAYPGDEEIAQQCLELTPYAFIEKGEEEDIDRLYTLIEKAAETFEPRRHTDGHRR